LVAGRLPLQRCGFGSVDSARVPENDQAASINAVSLSQTRPNMLKWALIFLVISVVAGFFGFSGLSAATAGIAKILFFIAIAVFLIFLVLALMAGNAIL
jgi:uncharacterized membrane protein YtjA (UPF0391 family)